MTHKQDEFPKTVYPAGNEANDVLKNVSGSL